MNETDNIIQKYYTLKPSEYGYLEKFELYRSIHAEGCSEYSLKLQMSSLSNIYKNKRLHLLFTGIKDLKLGDIDGLFSLLIEIRSIKEHQLENLKYKIIENEYETFSFLCSDFEAIVK